MRSTLFTRGIHLSTGLLVLLAACGQTLTGAAAADIPPGLVLDTPSPAPHRGSWVENHGNRIRTSPVYSPIDIASNQPQLVGGTTFSLSVRMNTTVQSNITVQLVTDQPGVFSNFPVSVVIPAGTQSISIPVTTVPISGVVSAQLKAATRFGSATSSLIVTQ